MSKKLSLFLAFLISPSMIASVLIPEASAQEDQLARDIQVLLPGHPAIADGDTEITYYFLFVSADGQAIKELSGRATLGKLKSNIRQEKNGLYSASFTPEKITEATEQKLSVSLRNGNRQSVKKEFTVQLIPSDKRTFKATTSPEEITLGLDEFVSVTVEQTSGPQTSKIDISSSVGSVDNIVNLGNGKFSARYTPPKDRPYPHIALFTVTDLENPKNTTALSLIQKGKTNFPINSLPNANIILKIEGRDFGPVQTDSSGKTSIPIVVPPGVGEAKLIVISENNQTEEPLDLRIPQNVPRLNFFPNPSTIPADGKTSVNIQVYVSTTTGKPDKNATLFFKAERGTVTPVQNNGNGVYSVIYKPPLQNRKSTDNIRVVLQSETGDVSDNLPLVLSPTLPEKVRLSSATKKLPKNASSFSVITNLQDRNAYGMSDRGIHFTASGAKILQSKELGSGDYTTKFAPTSNGPIEITAFVKGSVSDNQPFGITMLTNHSRIVNDGVSTSLLTFIVYDQYGYPLANQKLDLRIVSGDGLLPSETKTNSAGIGQVSFTAGKEVGVVQIQAKSSTLSGQFSLLQLPKDVLPELDRLPQSQNNVYHRLEAELQKSISSLRIEREGMEGLAIKADITQAADVEKINVKADPAKLVPGGKLSLRIGLTDNNGRGVAGEKLEVLASSGTVGRIQELGGGQYAVSLIAPDKIGEPIQITVNTLNETVQEKIILDWLKTEATMQTDPVEEIVPEKKKKPSREISPAWLRASAGFSGGYYHYQQVPASADQKLYRETITFNAETEGSSPAPSAGVQLRVFGKIPTFSYLGYDVNVSIDRYSVLLSEFGEEPIPDSLSSFDIIGRAQYPLGFDTITFTPSARFGLIRDDLLLFLQETIAEDKISLSYQPLWANAFSVGIGAQIETQTGIFASINYDAGLRAFSPYRNKIVGQVGYSLPGNLFIFGGGKSSVRDVYIENSEQKIGEIHDMHRAFTIGLGYGLHSAK